MAYNNKVRRYNSYGEEYEVPRERVYSIYEIQRGDHIAFHQHGGAYWHHAIVECVAPQRRDIHVFEYSNSASGFLRDNFSSPKNPGKAKVIRGTYRFDEVDVYRMIHERTFDPDTVVRRARSALYGENDYNLFTNNCEHFAMWCKTGRSSSDQVNKLAQKVAEQNVRQTVTQTASQVTRGLVKEGSRMATRAVVTRTASQAGREFVRRGTRMATQRVLTQATTRGGQVFARAGAGMASNVVAGRAASQAGRVIMRTGMTQSVSQAGQETAAASLAGSGVGGALAGGALAAGIEGVSMIYDISRAHDSMMEGRISEREFDRTVGKRVTTGVGNVGGTIAGAVIGQALIPVPVLGGIVGGLVGALGGSFLGNIYGNVLFD